MKQLLFVAVIGLFGLSSCATARPYAMSGTFQGKFLGFKPRLMKLHLSEDSTFNIQAYHRRGYTGKWIQETENSIRLIYEESYKHDLSELLASPYWDPSDHIIRIINKNKLQYDERTKLKRVRTE